MATVSTTTLKLSDDLKSRIALLAEEPGKSAHAFMVAGLETEIRRAELRRESVASALLAEREVAKYGDVYSMDAVHRYFRDKLAGKSAKRPKPLAEKNRR